MPGRTDPLQMSKKSQRAVKVCFRFLIYNIQACWPPPEKKIEDWAATQPTFLTIKDCSVFEQSSPWFEQSSRGLKAPRGMNQSSAEPVFTARPWLNKDRRGPDQSSPWSGTKLYVVRNKALRVFSKDLQIASATNYTESFVPDYGDLCSGPRGALFKPRTGWFYGLYNLCIIVLYCIYDYL